MEGESTIAIRHSGNDSNASKRGNKTSNAQEENEALGKATQQMKDSRNKLNRLWKQSQKKMDMLYSRRNEKEQTRRLKEEQMRQMLRGKLLAEAEASSLKNASIAVKWADLFTIEVPQELLQSIESQSTLCKEVIESKDRLISEMKAQIIQKDEEYIALLKRQSKELMLMLDSMHMQERDMKHAYQSESKEIEGALMLDRSALLDARNDELERFYEKRNQLEQEYIDRFLATAEEYEETLNEIRSEDITEYNSLKVKLETDVQTLEQHLETMRGTYQLNAEKLEYNYRVLLERDFENNMTINQQKRKVSKLRDVLCGLKSKHSQLERKLTTENHRLTEDYKRITEHFKELQLKFEDMERNEISKFDRIWRMKESQTFPLVQKMLDADRVIHEQLLGWTWIAPNDAIFKFENKNLGSESRSNVDSSVMAESQDNGLDDDVRAYIDSGVYHDAVSLICDEAGFLLDEKAMALIDSVPQNEQGYVKAEEVVQALGVKDASVFEALIDAITVDDCSDAGDLSIKTDTLKPRSSNEISVLGQSTKLVHPNEVLERLRVFVETEIIQQAPVTTFRSKAKRGNRRSTGLSRRAMKKEGLFWERLSNSVSSETFRMWTLLHEHLQSYHEMVKRRSETCTQVGDLKEENKQLRQVLNQYLSSKANEELVIPPIQTI